MTDLVKRLRMMADSIHLPILTEAADCIENGPCRFNCRTEKEAWLAGYEFCHGFELTEREREKLTDYYKEWKGAIKS